MDVYKKLSKLVEEIESLIILINGMAEDVVEFDYFRIYLMGAIATYLKTNGEFIIDFNHPNDEIIKILKMCDLSHLKLPTNVIYEIEYLENRITIDRKIRDVNKLK